MSVRDSKSTIVYFIKKTLLYSKKGVFGIIIGIFGLIMLPLVYFLMIGLVEYGLNVSMYCTIEKRYITHEENVEAAMKYYLENQFSLQYQSTSSGADRIFRYTTTQEFLKINPECCVMRRNELSGALFDTFYWRAFGDVSDIIDVYAKKGIIKDESVEWIEPHYPKILVADRCGKIGQMSIHMLSSY